MTTATRARGLSCWPWLIGTRRRADPAVVLQFEGQRPSTARQRRPLGLEAERSAGALPWGQVKTHGAGRQRLHTNHRHRSPVCCQCMELPGSITVRQSAIDSPWAIPEQDWIAHGDSGSEEPLRAAVAGEPAHSLPVCKPDVRDRWRLISSGREAHARFPVGTLPHRLSRVHHRPAQALKTTALDGRRIGAELLDRGNAVRPSCLRGVEPLLPRAGLPRQRHCARWCKVVGRP